MIDQVALRSTPQTGGRWSLPDGWEWRALGGEHGVCTINPRRPTLQRALNEVTSFIPMEAVDDVTGSIKELQQRNYGEVKSGFTYFEENDILFAKITPSMQNGKSAVARNLIDGFGFGSTEFHVLRPKEAVLPEWVHLFVRRLSFRQEAMQHFKGAVGQQRVPPEFLERYPIPLPFPDDPARSLATQRATVARIEMLFGELRELRKIHEAINRDVERLMGAVLEEVFEDIQQQHPATKRVDQITKVTSGGTPSRSNPDYYTGTVPWVKTGELKDGIIYDTEEHITEEAVQSSNAKKLPSGSLLIAMYGQGQTRGRTTVLGVEATTNQACCAILPKQDEFVPRYLQLWFMKMYNELRKQSEARGGNQSNLNAGMIKSLKPPLPSLTEQMQIVTYIDSIAEEIQELRKLQSADAGNLKQVEQSILEYAFRGEL